MSTFELQFELNSSESTSYTPISILCTLLIFSLFWYLPSIFQHFHIFIFSYSQPQTSNLIQFALSTERKAAIQSKICTMNMQKCLEHLIQFDTFVQKVVERMNKRTFFKRQIRINVLTFNRICCTL